MPPPPVKVNSLMRTIPRLAYTQHRTYRGTAPRNKVLTEFKATKSMSVSYKLVCYTQTDL